MDTICFQHNECHVTNKGSNASMGHGDVREKPIGYTSIRGRKRERYIERKRNRLHFIEISSAFVWLCKCP